MRRTLTLTRDVLTWVLSLSALAISAYVWWQRPSEPYDHPYGPFEHDAPAFKHSSPELEGWVNEGHLTDVPSRPNWSGSPLSKRTRQELEN